MIRRLLIIRILFFSSKKELFFVSGKQGSLDGVPPNYYMTKPLFPLVENRKRTEDALRFETEKYDPRASLDFEKMKQYFSSQTHGPVKRRGKKLIQVILNEDYVVIKGTTKPELKKTKGPKSNASFEEASDTLSKLVKSLFFNIKRHSFEASNG